MESYNERRRILDVFGEILIKEVRDVEIKSASKILNGKVDNKMLKEKYDIILNLDPKVIYALECLVESIVDSTLFDLMQLFESHSHLLKLMINVENEEYDFAKISEVVGSELSSFNDDGWIAMYSTIGRIDIGLADRIKAPLDWSKQNQMSEGNKK